MIKEVMCITLSQETLRSGSIGDGYYNGGTRNNPTSDYVNTDKIKITFDADPNSPSGYKMISAYPWYVP